VDVPRGAGAAVPAGAKRPLWGGGGLGGGGCGHGVCGVPEYGVRCGLPATGLENNV
jgi:hypothetical protein